jgi:hypothetical protein
VDAEKTGLRVGLPVYIAAAFLVIGGALFAYFQYGVNRADQPVPLTAEGKSYVRGGNLQLSDVTMKATGSYMQQTLVEIEGKITNTGSRELSVVDVYCIFYDPYGQLVLRRRLPIVSTKMGGLKPGETKSFRLPFDDLPQGWNQKLPQLVIAGMKFQG